MQPEDALTQAKADRESAVAAFFKALTALINGITPPVVKAIGEKVKNG